MFRALPLVLARVPDAQWAILGDGPLRSELTATAIRAGLDSHVAFLGQTSDRERDEWLSRARLFAMPSRIPPGGAGEGFGIVFLEAGRYSVPAVTGTQGGGAEAVIDGVTGTLVDPLDHIALADAISDLLTDDDLNRRYGAAAHSRAAQLSWKQMAQSVETILEEAIRS
jgi:phosphatidylinositol alpha-1,6-mannosyltransferase